MCGRLSGPEVAPWPILQGRGGARGLGEELGYVWRRTCCVITSCAGSGARGSWGRPAEPRYPGAADCFFAQEPAEELGGVSGTIQGDPDGAGGWETPLPAPVE